ncbi:hypothetical protein ACJX0J_041242, partial [Zea mays]
MGHGWAYMIFMHLLMQINGRVNRVIAIWTFRLLGQEENKEFSLTLSILHAQGSSLYLILKKQQ